MHIGSRRWGNLDRPVCRWFAQVPRVDAGGSETAKPPRSGFESGRAYGLRMARLLRKCATWRLNMKFVKSLLLGSAAGLIAVGGAQAADLPVKAKAVEYVKICSLYGAGFYYMPGTDTCIKFGGYLRADTIVGAADYNFQQSSTSGNQGS